MTTTTTAISVDLLAILEELADGEEIDVEALSQYNLNRAERALERIREDERREGDREGAKRGWDDAMEDRDAMEREQSIDATGLGTRLDVVGIWPDGVRLTTLEDGTDGVVVTLSLAEVDRLLDRLS